MSLLKIPFLLAGVLSVWNALSPPHTSPQTERIPITIVGRFALSFVPFMKVAHAINCLSEVVLILAYSYPSAPLATLVLSILSNTPQGIANLAITPFFLAGSILTIAGAQLRFACYRALGPFFTFEMAIRQGHMLIRTGPYAYLRHPAYTGLIMTMIGAVVVEAAEGSWLRECGWSGHLMTKLYLWILAGSVSLISLGTLQRGVNEDRALKDKFGEEWSQWVKDTPYRMVPYVY